MDRLSRCVLVVVLLIMQSANAYHRRPKTDWVRVYQDGAQHRCYAVTQGANGDYVFAGQLELSQYSGEIFRTNAAGDTLNRRYFDYAYADAISNIHALANGGYVFVGYTFNVDREGWIGVVDSALNLVGMNWVNYAYVDYFSDVVPLADSGFLCAGTSDGQLRDFWAVWLDSTLTFVSQRHYGGSTSEECLAVEPTPDGGFVLVGVTGLPANGDFWILKLNSVGDSVTSRAYGGPGFDIAYDIQVLPDGNMFVAGSAQLPDQDTTNCWVLYLNSDLDTLCTSIFGARAINECRGLATTVDGDVVAAGLGWDTVCPFNAEPRDGEIIVRKVAAVTCDSVWQIGYFEPGAITNSANAVTRTQDGGFLIGGTHIGTTCDRRLFMGMKICPEDGVWAPTNFAIAVADEGDSLTFVWDDCNPLHYIYSDSTLGGTFSTFVDSALSDTHRILMPAASRLFFQSTGVRTDLEGH